MCIHFLLTLTFARAAELFQWHIVSACALHACIQINILNVFTYTCVLMNALQCTCEMQHVAFSVLHLLSS